MSDGMFTLTIIAVIAIHLLGLTTTICSFTLRSLWVKFIIFIITSLLIITICMGTVFMLLNAN